MSLSEIIMIKPKVLKKGDNIGVIAPCSSPVKERIEPSINFLKSLGFNVVVGKSVTSVHGFLSGDDEIRANDINYMFKNKCIDGIFVIRGGYGASRLLDKLDYKMIEKNPKFFAGYSDVTSLHIVLNQKCNLVTYHTPMLATELYKDIDCYTIELLKRVLFKGEALGKLQNPKGIKMKSLVKGKAKGILTGGNLSLLVSTLGTSYEINTSGKILFIEEVDEPLYKIDRMLLQLKQSGKLKDANGIILGSWTGCKASKNKESLSLMEIFNELLISENKPIIYNVMCGHCLPTMSLPLGSKLLMDSDNNLITDLGVQS